MKSQIKSYLPLVSFALLLVWLSQALPVMAKEEFERKATRAFYENRSNDNTLPTDQRILYIDSLISEGTPGDQPMLMAKRAEILADGCRYEEAYRQYDRAYRALPEDSLRLRLVIQYKMASNAFYASRYREASRLSLDLISSEKPDTLLWLDIEALGILAAMDHYRGKDERLPWFYQSMEECLGQLEKSHAGKDVLRKARTRVLLARAVTEPDPHKAFDQYMQAKAVETDSARIDGIINNIGYTHFRLGEYEKSRHYFESVLRSHRPGTARMCAVLNYIQSYLNEGNGAGADSAVRKYMNVLHELEGTPMEWGSYKILYDVHVLNGRKLDGLPYLERAVELLDSVNSPNNVLLNTDVSQELSELMLEKKYAPQILDNRKKTKGILVLCGVLAITGGALWFYRRKARRKESEAGEMAATLEETLTRHSEERKEIDQSLQMRGQELASLKLRNEMLRKALDSIVADVNRLESPRSELAKKVKETVKGLSGAEKSFNPRSVTLENVNQAFFDKLYKEHPELTNAERDMCAYALMGLQPKEIATLTNRSVKTVNCIRHNLRKKLGIPASDSTEAYMRMLSATANGEDMPATPPADPSW